MDFEYLESIIVSRIKSDFDEKIKKRYPNLNFTTELENDGKPKFPTVYVHLLPSEEIGQDLEGTEINGIYANFQINVTDNQSKDRTKEVMNEVKKSLKKMRFTFNAMPYYDKKNDTYYSIARAKRVIGANDIL